MQDSISSTFNDPVVPDNGGYAAAPVTSPTPTGVVQDGSSTAPNITSTGLGSMPANTPISSTTIAPTTPVTVPGATPGTAAAGISGAVSAVSDQTKTAAADAKAALDKSTTDVNSTENKILALMGGRSDAETAAGLPQKQTAITNVTNAIEADQRAQQNEVAAVKTNGSISQGAQQGMIDNINAKHASYQADLAITQAADNRDYTTVKAIVDQKYQLALEPLQQQLTYQKSFYDDNKALFDKSDDRQYQQTITESQRQYDSAKANASSVSDWVSKAISAGHPELISEFSKLDPTSKTFTADLDKVAAKLTPASDLTKTQISDASVRAGMDASEFTTLPSDVQNFFSQSSNADVSDDTSNLGKIVKTLTDVKSGAQSVEDAQKGIDGLNIGDNVKSYFKQVAAARGKEAPPKDSSFHWYNPTTWFKS